MNNTQKLAGQLEIKRTELKNLFDSYKVEGSLTVPADKIEEIEKRNEELKSLNDQYLVARKLDEAEKANESELKSLGEVKRLPIAGSGSNAVKSFGQLAVESGALKGLNQPVEIDFSMKTLMSTGAGFAPFNQRDNVVSHYPVRPLTLLDYIPSLEWNVGGSYLFMRGTTLTNNAAEKAESVQGSLAAFGESALAWTEVSVPLRQIGHFIPVSETQLLDAPSLVSLLNDDLTYMVKQRFEGQLISGAGTGVLIEGMTVVSGVQTQAKGADDAATAIFKAAQKVRASGFAEPNIIILHPTDYQGIRLLSNTQGSPLWDGGINYGGPALLWGIPVVQSTAIAQGTGFVCDLNYYKAIIRSGVSVEIDRQASDFTNGVKTIRADCRGALAAYRPSAGCKITGL